ncbi:hypothetical protein [Microbulbifer sp. TYP-18]|uniref:hypothetical protein n=1 Tax=Microbulbifer sp. TYP-18 TaxID=3230024 RepID=UPI0034C64B47
MLTKNLSFPVLLFSRNFLQGAIYSERQLCLRTVGSYEVGTYEGAEILDSNGALYKVNRVISTKNFFSTCDNFLVDIQTLFSRPSSERVIWVLFDIQFVADLDFNASKRKVSKFVEENGLFDRNLEVDDSIARRLDKFKSVKDLCGNLRGYSKE